MDDKAQISIEYLIIVGLGVMIAALITALSLNLFNMKDGVKELIVQYRSLLFNIK
jgi:uncharacterized protein (UPF0333 family)